MSEPGASGPTWHGFPRVVKREIAVATGDALRRIWRNQGGDAQYSPKPGLARWFDPTASGTRLRKALAGLESAPVFLGRDHAAGIPLLVGPPFTIAAGNDRLLLTPEGLGLLRVLRAASQPLATMISLPWELTDAADDFVLTFYREESTKRLRSVVGLQQGAGRPMLPASVAVVALLLLNGNVVPGRGLARPTREGLEEVDRAMVDIARAFVDALGVQGTSRSVSDGAFSLYGGYALTEARRRLGTDLSTDPVGVADNAQTRVIDRLAAELARRPSVTESNVFAAVEALGSAYDRRRGVLAAHGVANGIPGQGTRLARDFVEAFRRSRADVANA